MTWLRTFPVTRDANSRTWMSKKPDRKSVSTLLEEEDVLIFGNGSVNDSDVPCLAWAICSAVFFCEGVTGCVRN